MALEENPSQASQANKLKNMIAMSTLDHRPQIEARLEEPLKNIAYIIANTNI
jgi:hypothetical protein